jgi:hypothetical protein
VHRGRLTWLIVHHPLDEFGSFRSMSTIGS